MTAAPATIAFGATFAVAYQTSFPVAEAALIGLGSMTHCFDQNRRYVQLAVEPGGDGTVKLTAPADGKVAPPGHYMLFLLDQFRPPSEARIVKLQ